MTTNNTPIIHKVLPFDTKQGPVPGHELISHQINGSHVKRVVFERWDADAEMMVHVSIHWTKFTLYTKKSWPKGGRVVSVVLDSGQTILADSLAVGHNDKSYEAAPLICRDAFYVRSLCTHTPLLEVKGVREWSGSDRSEEATKKYLPCPWERDNAEFNARIAAPTQQAPEPFFAALRSALGA